MMLTSFAAAEAAPAITAEMRPDRALTTDCKPRTDTPAVVRADVAANSTDSSFDVTDTPPPPAEIRLLTVFDRALWADVSAETRLETVSTRTESPAAATDSS